MSEMVPLDEQPRLITMQVQIPDGRNGYVSLATNVDQFVGRKTIDQMLDKLMGAAERQRAKQQIPELQHELDGNRQLLDENRMRLAEMVARYDEEKRIRGEDVAKLTAKHREEYDKAVNAHFDDGKRGEFKPRGAQAQTLNALKQAAEGRRAAQEKSDNEHLVARSQLEGEIAKRAGSVAILERRIAECEALVNGSDLVTDLRNSA
jgi:hypothetical protein